MIQHFQQSIGVLIQPILQKLQTNLSHIHEPKCHSLFPILYGLLSSPQDNWMIVSSSNYIGKILLSMYDFVSCATKKPFVLLTSSNIEMYNSNPLAFLPIFISSCVYRPRFEHVFHILVFKQTVVSYIFGMCPNVRKIVRVQWDL
jgi:hypothetical protein